MRRNVILVAIMGGSLFLPLAAVAGTGQIVDGKVNLSVQFTYREADIASWKPLFDQASRLLYNATDGQLQLGTVRVSDCGSSKDAADVWILDGTSGAFANVLGLGADGHIYLSQVHKSTVGPALGQFGLVHEFGHYGFGLYDEYKGITVPGKVAPSVEQTVKSMPHQFCTAEDDRVACIMDGGTTIDPNHLRTEFCTAGAGVLTTRHNAGIVVNGQRFVNSQQELNNESCWETIARKAGLVEPTAVETTDPLGLDPIDWQVVPDIDRVVVCLDQSASMGPRPDKLALSKRVADLLVGLLHERKTIQVDGTDVTIAGENLALVSFSTKPTVRYPFREILSEATKDSARAVVDALVPDAIGARLASDLGAGVQKSLDLITGAGAVPACSETVILLSDGAQDPGTGLRSLVPALRARGVRVYTVAIGRDAEIAALADVADSTGGHFYHVTSAEEVSGVAESIAAAVRAAGALEAFADSTDGQDEAHAILIDSFAEEVTFALDWSDGTLDLTLTSPTGDVIDVGSAGSRPDVEADVSGSFLFLRVSHPELGQWNALVHPVQVPGTIQYGLHVSGESRKISLDVRTDQPDYTFPMPIPLQASLVADVPVAGAEVTAIVHRPGGSTVGLQFWDDGLPLHNDRWANDGTYGTFFAQLTRDGTYTFDVKAVNVHGSGPDPDLPFVEDGPGPPPSVAPFTRETTVTVEVTGSDSAVIGDPGFNPQTSGVGSAPSVTAFLGTSPNPLPGRGVLRYALASPGEVVLAIYDVSGRLIKNAVAGRQSAGTHEVTWEGTDLRGHRVPSGVYLYTFSAGDVRSRGRLMIVR